MLTVSNNYRDADRLPAPVHHPRRPWDCKSILTRLEFALFGVVA